MKRNLLKCRARRLYPPDVLRRQDSGMLNRSSVITFSDGNRCLCVGCVATKRTNGQTRSKRLYSLYDAGIVVYIWRPVARQLLL